MKNYLIVTTLLLLFFSKNVFSQAYNIKDVERSFTPSPTVTSLGNYGGIDLKKNSGAVSKSIGLFELKEGQITYNPSINYLSTGVKVNDYGSKVGIGWGDNVTAMVYRTVRSLPDERAINRVGDGPYQLNNYSQQTLDTIRAIQLGTQTDGEYDIFSYSIFGESGKFIIKNGQAVLLDHKKQIRIDVLSTVPYKFCFTKDDGTKFFFGINSDIEYTQFDPENSCDQDNPFYPSTPTAWFLSKIVSPNNDELIFNYGSLSYSYVYDYNESYAFRTDFLNWFLDPTPTYSHTACVRRKITNTKYLTSVSGSAFTLAFDYITRTDLPGDRLLSKIRLLNENNGLVRQARFVYDNILSSSTLETTLAQELNGAPEEITALKTRYFLSKLEFDDGLENVMQKYAFAYNNASSLPHRFSFSQDIEGYYNGYSNNSTIPEIQANAYIAGVLSLPTEHMPFTPDLGNRTPSLIGMAGLLTQIKYPTGGTDDISYEQNSQTVTKYNVTYENMDEFIGAYSHAGDITQGTDQFTPAFDQKIKIRASADYYGSTLPTEETRDLYYVTTELWNDTNHTLIGTFDLQILQSRDTTIDGFQLQANNLYSLIFKLHGANTYIHYSLKNGVDKQAIRVEDPYYGYRLQKVVSSGLDIKPVVRKYNYKKFTKTDGVLSYTDETSLNLDVQGNGYGTFILYERPSSGSGSSMTPLGVMHLIKSKADHDMDVFDGTSYSYSCVTEFLDEEQTSFTASQFDISPNTRGGRVLGDYFPALPLPYYPLSNFGWSNGLELKRYYGNQANAQFNIIKEEDWNYVKDSDRPVFFNYSAYRLNFEPGDVFSNPESNIHNYILTSHEVYSTWQKLNDHQVISYVSGIPATTIATTYRYNTADKLLSEEETYNSKNEKIINRINRPTYMVSSGHDPAGVYQAMVNNFILNPVIEQVSTIGSANLQTGLLRFNYFQPYTGIFVPQTVESQLRVSDPIETRFHYYDYNTKGNLVSQAKENGSKTVYLWSYKNQFPIAEIKNTDFATVKTILTESAINTFSALSSPSKTDIQNFIAPLLSAIPNAQIATYTYQPLVGMTSATDTKGQTTFYEYDSFQRLVNIKDQYGNIIKHTDYHYQNQ
ncbi:hypothetical protein HQ865_19170 [Mucilaginibacter mali]|uniref:YD repeat-containing protein n=1 Tax=Mucilaginibacter mali TaxID=2740462 RepID=A0A7D4UGG4_9SPHI|nr:hypothetical protein [Mucilaginibacter mali]QKJ31796.1 hypothetical protein HQ865_19170 [Mucilaginibacter mali]